MRALRLITLLALVTLALFPQSSVAGSAAGTKSKVVYAALNGGAYDLYRANVDGSGAVDITNNASDDVDPAVSPDGTRVVFSSNRGGSYDIFVMNVDGTGTPLRITADFGAEREPVWSPDGNKIVYASFDPTGTTGYDIVSINADGSNKAVIANSVGDDRDPAFSPDGAWIAWSHAGQLWQMTPAGDLKAQLVASGTVDTDPTFSPDSTRLAWNCGGSICAWGTDGYTLSAIAGPIAGLGHVSWSPDGARIMYTSASGIQAINPDGSGTANITGTATDVAGDWVPGLTNTRAPTISGSLGVGSTLVGDTGNWAGSSPVTFTYQWKRCNPSGGNGCVSIAGATAQSYTTVTTDLNARLRLFVTASSPAGTAVAASAPSGQITNQLSLVLPTIAGSLAIGSNASATTGSVGGGLGPAPLTYTFVWQRCDTFGYACVAVPGITGPTYAITNADSGHTLRVVVTATNSAGSATATSLATPVIGGLSPVNSVIPVIAGQAIPGDMLVATSGTWTGGAGISFSYQWQRCAANGTGCQPIAGATTTSYVVVSDDAGTTLMVTVTATNSYGIVSASSLPTVIVGATITLPGPGFPASTVDPHVLGAPVVGLALTATKGGFVGAGLRYAYQWQRCDTSAEGCISIQGATGGTYTPKQGDLGSTIRVVVTARNSLGSASSYSEVTSAVLAAPASATPSGTTQSARTLVLRGSARGDRLVVKRGTSRVVAGAGNDTIVAADGRREVIDCGSGRDTVSADRSDVLVHCEVVRRVKRVAARRLG
jgi:WD40-like Beta Propeller Repeat